MNLKSTITMVLNSNSLIHLTAWPILNNSIFIMLDHVVFYFSQEIELLKAVIDIN